jgi:hypothetical protein
MMSRPRGLYYDDGAPPTNKEIWIWRRRESKPARTRVSLRFPREETRGRPRRRWLPWSEWRAQARTRG